MAKIWISYRRLDSEAITGRIFDRLTAHFGKEAVFRDIDNIPVGIDFRQHIGDTLSKAGVVIAIVGPQWLGPLDGGKLRIDERNDPVRVEVEIALRRRLALVPVLIGEAKMPSSEQLPPSLMDFSFRNGVKVDPGVDFDYHMERLIRAVEALLPDKARTAARTPTGEKKAASASTEPSPAAARPKTATGERQQTVTRDRPTVAAAPTSDAGRKSAALGTSAASFSNLLKAWYPATRRARIAWVVAGILVALPVLALTTVMSGSGVRLWSGSDEWQPAATLAGHGGRVSAVAFAPSGRRIASASWDRSIRIWDLGTEQPLLTLTGRQGSLSSLLFSSDGKQILSGSVDGSIVVWDADGGQALRTLKHNAAFAWESPNAAVWSIAMSPDGKRIASASADANVRIWDVASGQETVLKGHTDEVKWVAFLGDGKSLVSASKDGTVKVWDLVAGRPVRSLSGHMAPAALSGQGKYLAVVASSGAVALWDAARFTLLHTIPAQGGAFDSLAFSSDGRRLAGGARDGSLRIWDVQNGQTLWSVKAHAGSIGALAFSPDGRRLVSGSDDKTLRIWMN